MWALVGFPCCGGWSHTRAPVDPVYYKKKKERKIVGGVGERNSGRSKEGDEEYMCLEISNNKNTEEKKG